EKQDCDCTTRTRTPKKRNRRVKTKRSTRTMRRIPPLKPFIPIKMIPSYRLWMIDDPFDNSSPQHAMVNVQDISSAKELDIQVLSERQPYHLDTLLTRFADIFFSDITELGRTSLVIPILEMRGQSGNTLIASPQPRISF